MSWTLFIEIGIFALLMGIVAWALFVPPRNLRKTMSKTKKNKEETGNKGGNQK
jgi:hypothetical protein